jgi:hypothetical protein
MSISRKLACGVLAAGAPLAAAGALALASSSSAATHSKNALPTLNLHMNGSAITVGGSKMSGAVDVRATVSGEKNGSPLLVRLNPGVSYAQAQKILAKAGKTGDPNFASLGGAIVYSEGVHNGATSDVETVLQPGRYLAIDVAGHSAPRTAKFSVSKSASPAKLPAASATSTSIEFAFRGPSTFKHGTMIRGFNEGWVVHMNSWIGVKSKSAGQKVVSALRAGKPFKQFKQFLSGSFFSLYGPVSHGAIAQLKLNAKPGFYVAACFMNTEDGREHTQLGMERLIQVK